GSGHVSRRARILRDPTACRSTETVSGPDGDQSHGLHLPSLPRSGVTPYGRDHRSMKLRLDTLKLICRKSEEVLTFSPNITFIHGTLSLGKSTVVRLVDFCLGGELEMTTAIQREFLAVALTLTIGDL